MAAYIILRITVHDAEKLKDYQAVAPDIIQQYGGQLRVRGGEVATLEGPDEDRRMVMIEFDSMEQAMAFYRSPEYTAAIALREGAADFEAVALPGIA